MCDVGFVCVEVDEILWVGFEVGDFVVIGVDVFDGDLCVYGVGGWIDEC